MVHTPTPVPGINLTYLDCCTGKMVILDGIHRVRNDTLSTIYQLVYDRELKLFDGSRLMEAKRYESLAAELGGAGDAGLARGKEMLHERRIYPVHPAFRLVALATPPTPTNPWLTAEIMGLFAFASVPTEVQYNSPPQHESLSCVTIVPFARTRCRRFERNCCGSCSPMHLPSSLRTLWSLLRPL